MRIQGLPSLGRGMLAGAAALLFAMPVVAQGTGGAPGAPGWLKARIAEYEKMAVGVAAEEVWSYTVSGQTVYLVRGSKGAELLDAQGKFICNPEGGGQPCAATYTAPNKMAAVWRDPRLGLTVKPKPDNTK